MEKTGLILLNNILNNNSKDSNLKQVKVENKTRLKIDNKSRNK